MILDNYITLDEEFYLIQNIYNMPFSNALKRRVQQYGYKYSYDRNITNLKFADPIPEFLVFLLNRINMQFGKNFNQIIINEYIPGQGISPHIDDTTLFGDTIISVSLNTHVIMNLEEQELFLQRRSALILHGYKRYELKHGIKAKKSDIINGVKYPRSTRVSITFREIVNLSFI
mgnify:CR=1 FL=1